MLTLSSDAIAQGGTIPELHLGPGHGEDVSPALRWTGAPEATAAFALTLTDDDAPGYQHWLVVLDGSATGVERGRLDGSTAVGRGTRAFGYEGPCPPSGTHHYRFTLRALSACPGLRGGFTADELERAVEGLVLETATLEATYTPSLAHQAMARGGRALAAVRRRLPGKAA